MSKGKQASSIPASIKSSIFILCKDPCWIANINDNVHDNLLPQNLGFHKLLVAKEPYRSILCGGHSVLNLSPFVLDPSELFCLIMGLMYHLQNVSISARETPECSSRSTFSNVLWEATEVPQETHRHKDPFCSLLPSHATQNPLSIWSSSPLNGFSYWASVLLKEDSKSKKWLIVTGATQALWCLIHLCASTEHGTTEVLNTYLWMKTNKYFIQLSIQLFARETLIQLLLGCEDHLLRTSVSASLQLAGGYG